MAAALWIAAGRLERINLSRIACAIFRGRTRCWRFVWSTNLSGSLNVGSKQVLILLIGAIEGETAGGYRVASQLGQALVCANRVQAIYLNWFTPRKRPTPWPGEWQISR